MARLPVPWLRPTSVDPKLFVNRAAEVDRLSGFLADMIAFHEHEAVVLISGDRGIGKSIFGRAVLDRLTRQHPVEILPVVIDGRGADLDRLARDLVGHLADGIDALRAKGAHPEDWLRGWSEPLHDLYFDRVVRGTQELQGRELGAAIEAGGSLWGVLQSKLSGQWKSRTEHGQRLERTLEVSAEVRLLAVREALRALAGHVTVVVLYDDLDQSRGMDHAEDSKQMLESLLRLTPAISLVHLRHEVKFPEIRREHFLEISLGPLNPSELEAVVQRRLDDASPDDQRLARTPEGWAPFRQLLGATGNPLVYLRWMVNLVMAHRSWPPAAGWDSTEGLRALALGASAAPSDVHRELLTLGHILDRVDRSYGVAVSELQEGRRALDTAPVTERLDALQIRRLIRHELLMQVDRFDPELGLRLDPLLELIRPSVAARVAGG